jgi:hypothetical protein
LHTPFELQTITTLSLIFTIYKSPQHLLSIFQPAVYSPAVPWQRLLTVEMLQLHALTSLLSGEYPATELNSAGLGSSLYSLGADLTENLQQFFYYCYGRLPSDSPDIVDVLTGRYQATHIPSRHRCIATVLHATIFLI